MDAEKGDHRPVVTTFVGATGRGLTFTIKDYDGTAKNLLGTISLFAREGGADGTVVIDALPLTVAEGQEASGICTAALTEAHLVSARELDAQVRIAVSSLNIDYTEQFRIVILPIIEGAGA